MILVSLSLIVSMLYKHHVSDARICKNDAMGGTSHCVETAAMLGECRVP